MDAKMKSTWNFHDLLDSLIIQLITLEESNSIIILFPVHSSLLDDSSSALITVISFVSRETQ
jgi:hypothetical protein